MAKPPTRPYSRYSQEAVVLLGHLVRQARIERRMTTQELAERAGMSRGLIQRIEKGDPGCGVGAVFETAAIVGVRLFDADMPTMTAMIGTHAKILTLLPKAAHAKRIEANDDF